MKVITLMLAVALTLAVATPSVAIAKDSTQKKVPSNDGGPIKPPTGEDKDPEEDQRTVIKLLFG